MTAVSKIKITPTLKKLSGKPLGVASKVMGVAALAAVVYDAHINGREKAYSKDMIESGDKFYNQYKQFMTSDKESATISKMKKLWFDMQQNNSGQHLFTRAKGYLTGAGETIIRNLPVIALSALALKFKTVGKISGCLLGAIGLKTLLYDVAGVGEKKLNRKY